MGEQKPEELIEAGLNLGLNLDHLRVWLLPKEESERCRKAVLAKLVKESGQAPGENGREVSREEFVMALVMKMARGIREGQIDPNSKDAELIWARLKQDAPEATERYRNILINKGYSFPGQNPQPVLSVQEPERLAGSAALPDL